MWIHLCIVGDVLHLGQLGEGAGPIRILHPPAGVVSLSDNESRATARLNFPLQ